MMTSGDRETMILGGTLLFQNPLDDVISFFSKYGSENNNFSDKKLLPLTKYTIDTNKIKEEAINDFILIKEINSEKVYLSCSFYAVRIQWILIGAITDMFKNDEKIYL